MRFQEHRTIVAVAAFVLAFGVGGCGWLEKTVECYKLSEVSNRWSESAEAFGNELEAELKGDLQSLEHFDTSSRAGFTQASHDLRGASETLDGRVGVFVKDFARDFQAIPLKDPQLVEFRGRYIAQVEQMGQDVHELSTTVRDLGDLFARIDPAAITSEYQARRLEQRLKRAEARIVAAERGLDGSTKAEEKLIQQINAYCQLPTA